MLGCLFGALVAGGGAVVALRPRAARAERRARELEAEARRLRQRVGELTSATADVFDASARRIEQVTRDAERAAKARAQVDDGLLAGLQGPAGSSIAYDEVERASRQAESTMATLNSGLRSLSGEAAALERASAFISELAKAIESEQRERAEVDALADSAGETIAAAAAMDDALQRVQERAGETQTLSAETSAEAERGYRAVHRTLDEIERIRELTEIARTRILALGERVAGIGDVVRVIQEIAEKTNLLALNASIIAAQAGEHGRSFAVVAREIKALANRTAASTKEISDQIRGVQEESERATAAMGNGSQAVHEGFQVAIAAGDALTAIRESARKAQKRVQSMTRSFAQQASATRQVVDLAGRVSDRANAVAAAVRSQSSERLSAGAAELQATAARMVELVAAQRSAAAICTDAFGEVIGEIATVTRIERELRRQLAGVRADASSAREQGAHLSGQLAQVRDATEKLRLEIGRLQTE
jgi:methyl-accepting chemotaxis protein